MDRETAKKNMRKLLKSEFAFLIKEHGFIPRGISYIRISRQILQFITFDSSRFNLDKTTTVHVQLLIEPLDFIHCSLGGRIRNPGDWYAFDTEEQALDSVARMKENVLNVALPYLNDSSDLESIASSEYQTRWSKFWGDSAGVDYMRAFLYAFLNRKLDFMRMFEKIAPIYEQDDRDWAVAKFERLKSLKQNFDNRPAIKNMFAEWMAYTVRALKLDNRVNVNDLVPNE